jgi:hypothetical protein
MRADLERVRQWADAKLATGEEPPWAWYQYMKLRETLDAILAGFDAVMPLPEDSPQPAERSASGPRLVVCNAQPRSAPHYPGSQPVPLPM